jgi:hypothetical protein
MTIRRQLVLCFLVHERNWLFASSSSNCTRCSHGGVTILARRAGLGFMSSSVAHISRGIARQRASTSDNFSISRRVTTLNEKIDWPTPKVSVTSTPRLIYWRDHIVDQRASNLLFGDRRRLQEDLLADAARAEGRKHFPKMRGCPSGAHRPAR